MTVKYGILCEILFIDDKSGAPTNIIGRIDEVQFQQFNNSDGRGAES